MRRLSTVSKKSVRIAPGAEGLTDPTHDAMGSKWSKGLWDNMESEYAYE